MIGGVWWHGTKDYNFLKPPSPTQIAFARMRAAGELAQPSDLFAVEPIEEPVAIEIKPPKPPPEPPPPIPTINVGDLNKEPKLEAWTGHAGKPATSFVNLASQLESDTQLTWALLAWERVLDSSSPSQKEREVALNAIRRLHATLPPWNEDPKLATPITLSIEAPADRLKLSVRAANNAAKIIDQASSGLLKVSSIVKAGKGTAASPKIRVMLTTKALEDPASVETPSPETAEEIEKVILSSVFKLVGSQLALRDDLSLVSSPSPGEPINESLEYRITRLTWQKFAESMAQP